ncbi:hypothetical protein GE061_017301 [Apolygus lucorum]|uniref:Kinesin-like protein n=1 Tax=Apolygus lucorum TaxID=248454 RepID=A0A8S9XDC8_APOLU|nr:hypothetical protein GE061_017301 [Apolygus lucorum]
MCDNFIQAGLKVLIKRNDGRTHYAIISNVSENTRFVAVEWFEGGDAKGKEVDFDTLFELNPHLKCGKNLEEVKGDRSRVKTTRGDGRRHCVSVPSRSRSAVEKTSYAVQFEVKVPNRTTSSVSLDKIPMNCPEPKKGDVGDLDSELTKQRKSNVSGLAETFKDAASTKTKAKKKSSTVKEVEKLQKNRELRRQKQAEKKEEKEALLTIHSGNPNWQFQEMIKDYQGKLEFKPLTETDEVTENHQITVCVRKRPLNRKEKLSKEVDVISVPRKNLVVVHEPKNKVDLTKYLENQQFRFDYTFDEMCNNETVYNFTAKPLVETIFEGGMATCFAYGQTGSGKTHTMSGAGHGREKGIYAMVAMDVFRCLRYPEHENKNLMVSSSYYEIYGGKVYDLLAKKARLRVLEDGKQQVQIVGLTEKIVKSVEEVLFLIDCGNNARTSGRTTANSSSSRSHAIFQITLRQGNSQRIYGRIHLIDLAGNERGADTSSASRITRLEGAEINKSLLALKECIRALGRKGSHLPFRGSTLTLVLRDSFIGDKTKTCMIAMISPGMSSCEHSINTLRYADRVKELASNDSLFEVPDDKVRLGWNANKIESDTEEEDVSIASRAPNPTTGHQDISSSCRKSNKMQYLEQEMVSAFQLWTTLCPKFDERESQLLLEAHKLAYDPEHFSSELDRILGERQKFLSALRDRVTAFRLQMDSEEELNKENYKRCRL